jgi:DNA-binding XRE family transcriptional regulator
MRHKVTSKATSTKPRAVPIAVERAIRTLGGHIAEARIRRRMSQQNLADRIGVSRLTIIRIERGHPRVEIAAFVAALWALDLHHDLSAIASLERDPVGATLAQARLGTRARGARGPLDDDF